jgi:hypothetical protein
VPIKLGTWRPTISSVQRRQTMKVATVGTGLLAGTAALGFFVSAVGASIVGASGIAALILWHRTFLRVPPNPAIALPPYLAAVAGFYAHLIEEYLRHYAPAISRLFGIAWTDSGFVVSSYALAAGLSLVAVGLYYRSTLAGFVAWLFLISRLAELLLFVFPLIRPSIAPDLPNAISRTVASGAFVADMPNYYYRAARSYYFPGMYTVALTIIPALYAMHRIWTRSSRPLDPRLNVSTS